MEYEEIVTSEIDRQLEYESDNFFLTSELFDLFGDLGNNDPDNYPQNELKNRNRTFFTRHDLDSDYLRL